MYDINIKNVKKGKNFYLISLLIGLSFFVIVGGVVIFNNIKLNRLDSETTSTRVDITSRISDGARMYSKVYYYEVDGKEYGCTSSMSSNVYPDKKNGIVYYDSKEPSNCISEYSKSGNNIIFIFLLIPLLFIVIAIINMMKIEKRVKAIQELNTKGKLVKNLPYRLEDTGMSVNHVRIQRLVVDYVLPSGTVITLRGDPRHDRKNADADGMVDLVIDESNPDNYFIDFEINRLSGNLPQDYSMQNMQQQYPQQGYLQQNMNDNYTQSSYNYNDINRPL